MTDALLVLANWLDAALAPVVAPLNAVTNAVGGVVLAPVAVMPGWLSATLAAVLSGLVFLVVFKYTSPQRAIKKVRADIKAHLLALKLFKESTAVTLEAQGRLFRGAFWLLVFAVVPMLVMTVPALLILAQLGLWYQARPLKVGEETEVIVYLSGDEKSPMPEVRLEPTDGLETVVGPVRVPSQREVVWSVKAVKDGYHRLVFKVDGQEVEKELAVGDGFMRVSAERPGWSAWNILLNPAEEPFRPDSPVRAIQIVYPPRSSFTSGTDLFAVYWCIVSLVAAFVFRKPFNVNV